VDLPRLFEKFFRGSQREARAQRGSGLGLAVVGGLLVSQLLTLYITPVFYIYMERVRSLGGKNRARRHDASAEVVLQS